MGKQQTQSQASKTRMQNTSYVATGVVVAFVVAIVFASFALTGKLPGISRPAIPATDNPVVFVHDADGVVHKHPLFSDGVLEVATSLGTNTITIAQGEVFISESNCDGHDCMRQGHISHTSEQLICMPHKLWVEIRVDNSEGQMDPDAAGNEGGHLAEGEVDTYAR